jgi:hypothetical protein
MARRDLALCGRPESNVENEELDLPLSFACRCADLRRARSLCTVRLSSRRKVSPMLAVKPVLTDLPFEWHMAQDTIAVAIGIPTERGRRAVNTEI